MGKAYENKYTQLPIFKWLILWYVTLTSIKMITTTKKSYPQQNTQKHINVLGAVSHQRKSEQVTLSSG